MKNLEEKVNKIKAAIEHCKDVANSTNCKECAIDHLELAEWLNELLWCKYYTESGKLIKKYKFEPGDRVVVRYSTNHVTDTRWLYREFSHMTGKRFCCTDGDEYSSCLPFNENTKKLVGTYDDSDDQSMINDEYDLSR